MDKLLFKIRGTPQRCGRLLAVYFKSLPELDAGAGFFFSLLLPLVEESDHIHN